MSENHIIYFATCPVGCETFLADELTNLGFSEVEADKNGVYFKGNKMDGPKACLYSRLASRILVPITDFYAQTQDQLYRNALKVPWEEFLSSLNTFAIHGIGTNAEIKHSGFLALKVKDALVDRMRKQVGKRPTVNKQNPDVRIVVRLNQNTVSLSLDLSGISLHKRGWRKHVGEAPLKESLASTLLMASGYNKSTPLLDPMCGSGTLLIEAAEMALNLAPGRRLTFGFESWPTFPRIMRSEFNQLRRDEKNKRPDTEIAPVFGIDNNPLALGYSRENVKQAGLEEYITIESGDALKAKFENDGTLLVTNPPYGERIEMDEEDLLELYRTLGKNWLDIGNGKIAVFCAHPRFRKSFGLKPGKIYDMFNGPIKTRLFLYEVGRKWAEKRTL